MKSTGNGGQGRLSWVFWSRTKAETEALDLEGPAISFEVESCSLLAEIHYFLPLNF